MPRPPLQNGMAKIGRVTRQGHALHAADHVLLLVVGHSQRIGERRAIQNEMVQLMELRTDLPQELSMQNRFVGQSIERTVIHRVEFLSSCTCLCAQDRSGTAEAFPQLVEAHENSSTQTVVPRTFLDALAPTHPSQPSDQDHRFLKNSVCFSYRCLLPDICNGN